jgi:hypothetical protein
VTGEGPADDEAPADGDAAGAVAALVGWEDWGRRLTAMPAASVATTSSEREAERAEARCRRFTGVALWDIRFARGSPRR